MTQTGWVRRALGVAVIAALVGSALLVGGSAQARAAAPCPRLSLTKQIRQADVVFRGVVDKVRPVRGKGDHRLRNYKVKADRVYRSSLVADAVVVTAQVGAKCPPPTLAKGKRYIFFVTEQGSRLVSTSATARASKKLTDQVVAKLGNGVQPHPAPPASATFSKVADASPPSLSRLLSPGAALLIVSILGLLVAGRLGRRTT
ncbi:MAG TPA: hypothetical protein VGK78_11960 [Nocardioides sp.]|uniref:hypothetical protein n=1 Tax=Nocardioides sp. TaxID=35761 RepID=UPI002F3F7A43